MNKRKLLLALLLPAGSLFAQDSGQVPGNTAPPALQKPYEAAKDFFNIYGLASFVTDTNGYYNAGSNPGAGYGAQFGGGLNGYHDWNTSLLSLSYRGELWKYATPGYSNYWDQNLSFGYQKRTRRWIFNVSEAGGQFFNGGTFFSSAPNAVNPSNLVQTNAYSYTTKFLDTTLSAEYRQTQRLSYTFSGSYLLTRYTGTAGTNYGANDITGMGSVNYRVSRSSTISGTYSHSNFKYQHGAGSSNVDSAYVSLAHQMRNRWQFSVSGGISRANSVGIQTIPVTLTAGSLAVSAFAIVPYNQTSYVPYYQGTLTHNIRHDTFSLSGGESVTPGNGFYLASKTTSINGVWSRDFRRANASVGGYWARLSSISTTQSGVSQTRGISVSYSYNVIRHLGMNARYDYVDYSSFGSYGGRGDSRITFGVYWSSKDIPLSLY